MDDELVHGISISGSGTDKLTWAAESGASAYNVYRGSVGDLPDYGSCYRDAVPGTSTDIPEDPPVGQAYFYLVTGEFARGEGSAGNDSSGAPRNPKTRCP